VEQSCYRCGARFDEGVAFCPNCNAPQIRVVTEPGGEFVASPESISTLPRYPARMAKSSLEWPEALAAAALSNLIAGILLVLVLGLPPALGVLTAGFLAVVFYRKRLPFAQLGASVGARLGTLSGAVAFVIVATSLAAGAIALHSWQRIQHSFLDALREASSRSPYPVPAQALEFFQTPLGFAVFLITTLVSFLIFASLGGIIGGVVLRRGKPPGIDRS